MVERKQISTIPLAEVLRHPLIRREDGLEQQNEVLLRLLCEAQSNVIQLSAKLREAESQVAVGKESMPGAWKGFSLSLRLSLILGKILGMRSPVARLIKEGNAARDSRQWAEAAKYYSQAVAANPRNGPIWVQLGNMRKDAGQFDLAAESYDQAIRRMPFNADPYVQLGHLRKLQGDSIGARRAFRMALERDGMNRNADTELKALR